MSCLTRPIHVAVISGFIAGMAFMSPSAANEIHRIEAGLLTYSYEAIPILDPRTQELMFNSGKITVIRQTGAHRETIYQEHGILSPGCDDQPALSKLRIEPSTGIVGEDVVLLCGSSGGRQQTLKLFREAPQGLITATLNFYNSFPKLRFDETTHSHVAMVARRDLIPGQVGPIYFPFLYRLHIDVSTMAFAPVFGGPFERHYVEYYRALLTSSGQKYNMGPAVASLMATQNHALICEEISKLERLDLSHAAMLEYARLAVTLGYPAFDFNRCE